MAKKYRQSAEIRAKKREEARKWRAENPEAWRRIINKSQKKIRLKKLGYSVEFYDKLFEQQGGVCKICGKNGARALALDHDHSTGLVRGLLCGRCNLGLGHFRDNVVLLQSAIRYLETMKPGEIDDPL